MRLRAGALAGWTLAALACGGALGGWPTWKLGGAAAVSAMAVAAAAAVVAFVAGLLVTRRLARGDASRVSLGFLAAAPVRMVLTIGLALLASAAGGWPIEAALLWSAIWYLLLLGAEVAWLGQTLGLGRPDSGKR